MKRHFFCKGFTLIELMIALAALTILAVIALPSYQRYIKDTRLKQASAALLDNAHGLEQFYSQHRSFKTNSTTWASLAIPKNDYFCMKMQGNAQGALNDSFTIKAVAFDQKNEPRVLRINQDMILTVCESTASSCSETNPYFSNANGTDKNCTVYE
ncbi:Pilin [Kingella potus]|uniref:Pilin n=2 Tax=Kingella potus TaxID=265175 RepID=A0A377QZB0_9NEIS|nr:type IV pilin protein [Kingella potus]UOP01595.1 type IV pilin protein [Kingella potus]STR00115.1 Pilin [Kingella potus]